MADDAGAAGLAALRGFVRAAQAGDPAAMNMVGRCYEQGCGVVRDPRRAVDWFEAAAARSDVWGLYNLATQLALGDGTAADLPRALALFRRAAAMGHAKSMTMIGLFHEEGWVVPSDRALAMRWYALGADAGDFRGQFNHARMLAEAGRIAAAARRVGQMRGGATPAFLAKAQAWLASHPDDTVRALAYEDHALGVDAL